MLYVVHPFFCPNLGEAVLFLYKMPSLPEGQLKAGAKDMVLSPRARWAGILSLLSGKMVNFNSNFLAHSFYYVTSIPSVCFMQNTKNLFLFLHLGIVNEKGGRRLDLNELGLC